MIRTNNLKRYYRMGPNVVRALDGATIQVAAGEFVGLLGTSGSGKSTLLNLIGGLDRPTDGSVEVNGRQLAAMNSQELSWHRRKNVGFIFQSFNLIPTMTALENVALALAFDGVARSERMTRARQLLDSVGLSARVDHLPTELSGGEQQRVSIARALANAPAILLADEPTGNLDSKTAHEILGILARLNREENKTVVLVTHDQNLANQYTHRNIFLSDGQVVA